MNKAATAQALNEVFDAAVTLYHRLNSAAAMIHRRGALSGPRRTVLLALRTSGAQTVSQMARARRQSRQRIQPLVNALLAGGLVESRPNPAHQHSNLIMLTLKGERRLARIVEREAALRSRLLPKISAQQLSSAAAIVREVAKTIDEQLPKLLKR